MGTQKDTVAILGHSFFCEPPKGSEHCEHVQLLLFSSRNAPLTTGFGFIQRRCTPQGPAAKAEWPPAAAAAPSGVTGGTSLIVVAVVQMPQRTQVEVTWGTYFTLRHTLIQASL